MKIPTLKTLAALGAALILPYLAMAPAMAEPEAHVTPLRKEALPEYPGKEAEMILVEYPPGSVDPVHRHDAHAFVYVLEGSIVMGLRAARRSRSRPATRSMKAPTTSIPSGATPARRSGPGSWWCSSRTKARRS